MNFPILSAIIFVPIFGAAIALFLPKSLAWGWGLAIAVIDLVLTIVVGVQFQVGQGGFQFTEHLPWIPGLGLNYALGVDGISVFLVILSALLGVVAIAASWSDRQRPGTYFGEMLLLIGGILGVFLATNVFLFYVFWEVMLVPAYLLIGTFGGPRRAYAAIKFVLFTAIGSLLMLAGVIGLGAVAQTGQGFTLDLPTLAGHVPPGAQMLLFLAFFAAFAVKVPLIPFHSWLPDAYSEAPIPVTVLLAGAMSKTGAYGFLRFCLPLFPDAVRQAAPGIAMLAVIGILYCAVQALVQTEFKRIIAYSSISHLGVVMLGIFALNTQGLDGAVIQMVNHGITTGALFLIAGFIAERAKTQSIQDVGGMAKKIPILATFFAIAAFSSLGLPGLNSFAGEFLALLGAFRANPVFGTLGTLVVIPAAWYLLRFFQGTMQGRLVLPEGAGGVPVSRRQRAARSTPPSGPTIRDLGPGDVAILLPLLALMIVIGVYPAPLPHRIEPSATQVLSAMSRDPSHPLNSMHPMHPEKP